MGKSKIVCSVATGGWLVHSHRGLSRWQIGGETHDSETRDSETRDSETRDSETRDSETRDRETRDSETRDGKTRLVGWRVVIVTMLADSTAGWVTGLMA